MKIPSTSEFDWELSYCSNVHPGETWTEVREALHGPVQAVKQSFRPDEAFGVGLRLSHRAMEDLQQEAARAEFFTQLHYQGLYVRTINGFPYGSFHHTRVKESVYLPDWCDAKREAYTIALAQLLAEALPSSATEYGSISTVPGGYLDRRDTASGHRIAQSLLRTVAELWRIREHTGKQIILGLEPEPLCMIETTEQCVDYFQQFLTATTAVQHLQNLTGLHRSAAQQALHDHLGVCFDVCHAAVEFEDCCESLQKLSQAGINIAKIQLSTALVLRPTPDTLTKLEAFADDTYLHQVIAQLPNQELLRFNDLPRAFLHPQARTAVEWRVHFHVPIFSDKTGPFQNTQAQLRSVLQLLCSLSNKPSDALKLSSLGFPHLEVETYSWNLIPPTFRGASLVDDIVRELQWVEENLS